MPYEFVEDFTLDRVVVYRLLVKALIFQSLYIKHGMVMYTLSIYENYIPTSQETVFRRYVRSHMPVIPGPLGDVFSLVGVIMAGLILALYVGEFI